MVEVRSKRLCHAAAHARSFGLNKQVLMERGNSTLVRVCMIVFGIAIVAIAPVVWI